MSARAVNWAGNVIFTARDVHHPTSVAEVQRLVAASRRVRALGTGHSFSPIADTPGDLVSVAGLPPDIELDSANARVRVAAGLRYGELTGRLQEAGFALHNLGSLPHISIAGACATGTHGSGDANGILAAAVSGVEMVTAGGDLASWDREGSGDRFHGAVVGLGTLGILTSLTLDLVPAYDMVQYVYEDLPRDMFTEHFEEVLATAYSISLFTDWKRPVFNQVWLKRRVDHADTWTAEPHWLGARLANGARHMIPGMSPVNCTQQMGVPGPWNERLPFFRLSFTPSSGEELQSEYLVPRSSALEALGAIDGVRDIVAPALQMSELRTIAADDLWMSPAHGRDSVGIHFTWIRDVDAVMPAVGAVEAALKPFSPRPHWGKIFSLSPEDVRAGCERLPDFAELARDLDPTGKFRNDMIEHYLGA